MPGRRGTVPRRRPRAGPVREDQRRPRARWWGRRSMPRREHDAGRQYDPGREQGMVTAETAAVLPVLVVVLVAAVWVVAAASAQLRCTDAAREAARALARGDGVATSRSLAVAVAPGGATVGISVEGDLVRVRVSALAPLPAPLGGLVPAPTLGGSAVAMRERPLGGEP
jgi:TadE-like protein